VAEEVVVGVVVDVGEEEQVSTQPHRFFLAAAWRW
jgi:hypothetical protein